MGLTTKQKIAAATRTNAMRALRNAPYLTDASPICQVRPSTFGVPKIPSSGVQIARAR
jgi:hypothetical protein